jgi:hypothetical protein
MEAEVTAADLLVLAPWLIFGAAVAAICYRLLIPYPPWRFSPAPPRSPVMGNPGLGVGGRWVCPLCLPAAGPLVTGISRGCARDIHRSSIAWTSPLRMGGLSRRQGLIARPFTTMR